MHEGSSLIWVARDQARMSSSVSDGRHCRDAGVTDSLTHSLNKHGCGVGGRASDDVTTTPAPLLLSRYRPAAAPLAPRRRRRRRAFQLWRSCLDTTFRFYMLKCFAYVTHWTRSDYLFLKITMASLLFHILILIYIYINCFVLLRMKVIKPSY